MTDKTERPGSWMEVSLGDLFISPNADIVDGPFGSNLKASEYVREGIPVARLQNIDRNRFVLKNIQFVSVGKADQLERHTFAPGDLLVTKLGDPLGKACIAPPSIQRGVLVADVVRARITHRWLDPSFLCYQFNSESVIDQFKDQTKGTTRPRVNLTKIRSLKLWLCPLGEQRRIVEKLEEILSDLDSGVAELQAAQIKLARYRHALLRAAVTGELSADWRLRQSDQVTAPLETGAELLKRVLVERRRLWEERQLARFEQSGRTPPDEWRKNYPEPIVPDLSGLPDLPNGWTWASIDQVALEMRYGSSAKTGFGSDGVPVIRMGNIQDGELSLHDLKFLPREHEEFPGLYLQDGDLLFNRTNSSELVGKTAVYRSQVKPCSYASYLIAVRFLSGCLPEFASAFINSSLGRRWVKRVATQQTGQANVNGSKLAALAIPLPPLDEQSEIVARLSAQRAISDRELEAIQRSLKQSEVQRKNILKTAFVGELLPQNPNDESAGMLLERIRAERAKHARQPKPRGKKQVVSVEVKAMMQRLVDVLGDAGDWLAAQEAFRRCGVAPNADTDQIEKLYEQLRQIDQAGRLDRRRVGDFDELRLKAEA